MVEGTRIDLTVDGGRQSSTEKINGILKELGVVLVNLLLAKPTKCTKNKQTSRKQNMMQKGKKSGREEAGKKNRGERWVEGENNCYT
jgi:hypothetical protein